VRERIVRICMLIEALRGARRGLSITALVAQTGASRATVYRDLEVLRAAGLAIEKELVNGQARHRILDGSVGRLALGAPYVAAIALAREGLAALEGTEALAALDAILADRRATTGHVRAQESVGPRAPAIVRALDRAIRDGRRVRISYRGVKDATWRWREVDPGALQLQRGELYLWAWAIEARAWRTFKLARMRGVETTQLASAPHPGLAEVMALRHAVRVWSGPLEDVAVRIAAEVAWLADEQPLVPDQRVEQQADGTVIVRATVAGLVEATRWVLRWGAHACVLEPRALRDAVRDELSRALAGYVDDQRVVSPIVRHPSNRNSSQARAAKRRQAP
jgi:predicted DNA-binding transcriptional regulator YafY